MTARDERMLEWLATVRMADMEAIRWALAGFERSTATADSKVGPVTIRRAQQWVARLHKVGLIGKARPQFQAGSIVWPTHMVVARTAPNLFRQTTRHEVAVALVSAKYIADGWHWARDRKPLDLREHRADGVALRGDARELIEVELTPKTLARYKLIHSSHAGRMAGEGVSRVVYVCTPEAARTVSREADTHIFRDLRPRLVTVPVLDGRGAWVGADDALFASPAPDSLAEISVPGELWDRRIG